MARPMTHPVWIDTITAAPTLAERRWLVLAATLEELTPAARRAVWALAVHPRFELATLEAELGTSTREEAAGEAAAREAAAIWTEILGLAFVEPHPQGGFRLQDRTRRQLLDRLPKG